MSSEANNSPMRILVVDDDPMVLDVMGAMLANFGHTVISASHGQAGLTKAVEQTPDMILSDIMMPGMDGLSMLKELVNRSIDIPVVILTAHSNADNAIKALRYGAFDYLCKPVKMDVMQSCLERIRNHLAIKKMLDQEREAKVSAEQAARVSRFHQQQLQVLHDELQQNLTLVETLLNTIPYPIFHLNIMGELVQCNSAFTEQLLGVSRERAIGLNLTQIAEKYPEQEKSIQILQENLMLLDHIASDHVELRIPMPKGQVHDFFLYSTTLPGAASSCVGRVGVLIDITRRKQYELQLRQAEKMQAIGQLAAGVAHEINNPVSFVMSNLVTMQDYMSSFVDYIRLQESLEDAVRNGDEADIPLILSKLKTARADSDLEFILPDAVSLLKESSEGAVRVRDIVQSLKSFSRVEGSKREQADLNAGIEQTLQVVWNELKYKCEVVKDLKPIPLLYCNPGQLNQVFMNLLVNASHAIEERGTITISTEATDAEVLIRISDTGCGINPDVLPFIFDPFFTTKDVGKGTGLGLSISHGIIEDHGGVIQVESEPGQGTTFTVRLPIQEYAGDSSDESATTDS